MSQFHRLIATEPEDAFKPTRVSLLSEATVGSRNDFLWAEMEDDQLVGKSYTSDRRVLLASRHHGYSLGVGAELPLDVYVCGVNDHSLLERTSLEEGDVSIVCWALLLAPEDERTELGEIYDSIKQVRGNVNYVNPVHR